MFICLHIIPSTTLTDLLLISKFLNPLKLRRYPNFSSNWTRHITSIVIRSEECSRSALRFLLPKMMQVSTMSHLPGRDEALEAQFRHQQNLYTQSRSRSHETAMMSAQYMAPSTQQQYGYAYQQRAAAPPSPPSPATDELNKPSLPSISSLLGVSEGL